MKKLLMLSLLGAANIDAMEPDWDREAQELASLLEYRNSPAGIISAPIHRPSVSQIEVPLTPAEEELYRREAQELEAYLTRNVRQNSGLLERQQEIDDEGYDVFYDALEAQDDDDMFYDIEQTEAEKYERIRPFLSYFSDREPVPAETLMAVERVFSKSFNPENTNALDRHDQQTLALILTGRITSPVTVNNKVISADQIRYMYKYVAEYGLDSIGQVCTPILFGML